MSEVETYIPTPLILTQSAADKIYQLMQEEDNPKLSLRVYIMGGGCSGFQYGFAFEEEIAADDTVIKKANVRVLVDPMSLSYLMGATIDYKDDLEGARFIISNPNATTTCGCGSSFATE